MFSSTTIAYTLLLLLLLLLSQLCIHLSTTYYCIIIVLSLSFSLLITLPILFNYYHYYCSFYLLNSLKKNTKKKLPHYLCVLRVHVSTSMILVFIVLKTNASKEKIYPMCETCPFYVVFLSIFPNVNLYPHKSYNPYFFKLFTRQSAFSLCRVDRG